MAHTYWKGKKFTKAHKDKLSKAKKGVYAQESNPAWKGDEVGYRGIHKWVNRWKGDSNICEHCGTTTAKKYEWSNIDHKYRRVLEDYIRLCTRCHRKYDYSLVK